MSERRAPRRASEVMKERVIAFHPAYVRATGSITAALFLSQLYFWQGKGTDSDGWIYKTATEWTEETGLSRREQDGARATLKNLGLITERRRASVGQPLEYLLNQARFDELIDYAPNVQKDEANSELMHQTAKAYAPNVQAYAPNRQSLYNIDDTENTPENGQQDGKDSNTANSDPWLPIQAELKTKMTKASFATWLQRTKYLGREGNTLVIGVPSGVEKEWLEKNLLAVVRKSAVGVLGNREIAVKFVISPVPTREDNHEHPDSGQHHPSPAPGPDPSHPMPISHPPRGP